MTERNDFMAFWGTLNEFAKINGLDEVLYRDARDYYAEFNRLRSKEEAA